MELVGDGVIDYLGSVVVGLDGPGGKKTIVPNDLEPKWPRIKMIGTDVTNYYTTTTYLTLTDCYLL